MENEDNEVVSEHTEPADNPDKPRISEYVSLAIDILRSEIKAAEEGDSPSSPEEPAEEPRPVVRPTGPPTQHP